MGPFFTFARMPKKTALASTSRKFPLKAFIRMREKKREENDNGNGTKKEPVEHVYTSQRMRTASIRRMRNGGRLRGQTGGSKRAK